MRAHQRRRVRHQLPQRRPFVVRRAIGQKPDQRRSFNLLPVGPGEVGEDVRQFLPVLLARGINQRRTFQDGLLIIALAPFPDQFVSPGGILVRVAEIAGIG